MSRLIVSGCTGFVGSYALPQLAKNFERITAIVRPKSLEIAQRRWQDMKNVEFLSGDLTLPGVFHDVRNIASQFADVTDVLHMGALYDLQASASDSYLANVMGTQNILDVAGLLPKLERFHHVSTVAISGDFPGRLKETMFNVGQKFSNPYAQTKYRAEGLVGSWKASDVKRLVYRLGIVVGDSQSGHISKIDGPYYLLDSLRRHHALWKTLTRFGRLPLPFDPEALLPLIPVDLAATQLSEMVSHPNSTRGRLRTYHLSGAHVPVRTVLERSLAEFGCSAELIAVPKFLVPRRIATQFGIPRELFDYMFSKCHYEVDHVLQDYPDMKPLSFDVFAPALFRWAKEAP
ncbi:MAG: SDR family oxidoreductase [Bdellovibrionota bacterium]